MSITQVSTLVSGWLIRLYILPRLKKNFMVFLSLFPVLYRTVNCLNQCYELYFCEKNPSLLVNGDNKNLWFGGRIH